MARVALSSILVVVALNAMGGGIYGLTGARDVPLELLQGSPFTTFFVPSLILLLVIGGSSAVASAAVIARWRSARRFALTAGVLLLGWIAVQLSIIGYVSWLQPTMAALGVAIVALAAILREPG